MSVDEERDRAIGSIESYCLNNGRPLLTVVFSEGDSYQCIYGNGEWEDNGEWNPGEDTRNLPGYEEWYELDLHVEEVLTPGPNKDSRYEWIIISRKHMPCRVVAGGAVLYEE